jgi:hypothetical protein
MKVHRTKHTANFTIAPNAILREERMSEMARLILLRLLSNTDDYEGATALKMWEDARAIRGDAAPGKRAFLNAFNEMEEFGYLVRTKVREGSKWVTHVDVYDTPQNLPEETSDEPSGDDSLGLPGFGKSEREKPEPGKSESGQSSKRTMEKDASRRTISSSSVSGHVEREPAPVAEKKTKTPESIVIERLGCTDDEARMVVDYIEQQGDGRGGRIRSLVWWVTNREERLLLGDLAQVRRHSAPPTVTVCGDHQQDMPPHGCPLCAGEIKAGDPDDIARLRAHLAMVGEKARPDLARLLGAPQAAPAPRAGGGDVIDWRRMQKKRNGVVGGSRVDVLPNEAYNARTDEELRAQFLG